MSTAHASWGRASVPLDLNLPAAWQIYQEHPISLDGKLPNSEPFPQSPLCPHSAAAAPWASRSRHTGGPPWPLTLSSGNAKHSGTTNSPTVESCVCSLPPILERTLRQEVPDGQRQKLRHRGCPGRPAPPLFPTQTQALASQCHKDTGLLSGGQSNSPLALHTVNPRFDP